MTDIIKDNFKDKNFCFSQLREARELFGNKNTTRKQYEAMEKVLALVYLYCPEEIQSQVLAIINELELRKNFFEIKIWKV